MRYHILSGRIEKASAKSLLEFIEENEGNLTIAIDSTGGEKTFATLINYALLKNEDRITLIALNIGSCAFDIFWEFSGEKCLAFGCIGMMHHSARDVSIQSNGKPSYDEGECHLKNLKTYRELELKIAQDICTKPELRRFKENRDVYFTFGRMLEIFKDAEVIY